jgi:Fe-S cluster biosynthesis and repair protein YggX
MTHMVQCKKLGKEAEGLERPPFPGDMGQRIFDNISKEAWQQWLGQQTILINEYRLSVIEPEAQKFLREQMIKFLFEGDESKPEEYSRPD